MSPTEPKLRVRLVDRTRNMALAGVPEKHIMQVTGHKTRHMIDRYNITVERDTQNILAPTQIYLVQQRQAKHGQNTDTDKNMEEWESERGMEIIKKAGAGGRNRTDTRLPSRDFESRASTSSTTPALQCKTGLITWLRSPHRPLSATQGDSLSPRTPCPFDIEMFCLST